MDKRLTKLIGLLKSSRYSRLIVTIDSHINSNTRTKEQHAISHFFHNAILYELFLINDRSSNKWKLDGSSFKINVNDYLHRHNMKGIPLKKIHKILSELFYINLLEDEPIKFEKNNIIYYTVKLNSKVVMGILSKNNKKFKSHNPNNEDYEWRSEVEDRIYSLEDKVPVLEKEVIGLKKDVNNLKENDIKLEDEVLSLKNKLNNSIPKDNMMKFLLDLQVETGISPSKIQEIYDENFKKNE